MTKSIVIIMLMSAILNLIAQANLNDPPLINVLQGTIKGLKEVLGNGKVFYSYYGIPYAEPPINNLRFKDPVPKSSWEGYYDGTKAPQGCPSNPYSNSQQEDCLTLNVFTPQSSFESQKFPVMVFIHGGLFTFGSSSGYEPDFLMDEEIVLVVIQYRLGILGFLSTEDEILPGNAGLKDQQLALKWVQENIGSFGGDPNSVTLFGQSAGGASVQFHMFSPGSKGLFQRGIMQSGTGICPFAYHTESLKSAKAAGDHFNCFLEGGTQNYLECMQSIDFRDLIAFANSQMTWQSFPLPFLPRVDGDFLPDRPEVLLKNGNYTKVDTISGMTREDGAIMNIGMLRDPTVLSKLNNNFEEFGPISLLIHEEENSVGLAQEIYEHYLNKTNNFNIEEDFDGFEKLFTDRLFGVSGYITGRLLAKDPDVNIYLYLMDHFGSFSNDVNGRSWVVHGDDLNYLFGRGGLFTDESDIRVRNFCVSAWTNFAKFGNPNPNSISSNSSWEEASESNFRYLSIKEFPEMKKFNSSDIINFWPTLETAQNKILIEN